MVWCEPLPLDMGGAPDLPQLPTRSHTLMAENYGRWHSGRMARKRVLPPLLRCPAAAGVVMTVCFRPRGYLYTVCLRRPRGTPSLCACVQKHTPLIRLRVARPHSHGDACAARLRIPPLTTFNYVKLHRTCLQYM